MAIRSDAPKGCSGMAQPGAVRLQREILAGWKGTTNMGLYNCRKINGKRTPSLHAEGRAIDMGIPTLLKGTGDALFHWAITNAEALGLQEVVWYGQVWSAKKPYVHGYTYGANHPNPTLAHRNHVHIGLNWDGARGKTSYFSGTSPKPGPPPEPLKAVLEIGLISVGTGDPYAGSGSYTARQDGHVTAKGVTTKGDLSDSRRGTINQIVGFFASPAGYWMVGIDGAVFAYGDALYKGGMNAAPLHKPITGGVGNGTNGGYWLVADDGGIFTFGNAQFFGSLGSVPLMKKVVAMEATRTGKGYWLTSADGGVFAFGDAAFYGSLGGVTLRAPIADICRTRSGNGYWLLGEDGGVFAFGDAPYCGSYPALPPEWRLGMRFLSALARYRDGYMMVGSDGALYRFNTSN